MHFDLQENFFEREVGIRIIGDLEFLDCRIYAWRVDLCGFLSSSVFVSSVQLEYISAGELGPMVQTQCVNILMAFFFPLVRSSFATCMRCGGDVSALIGATAISTKKAVF